MKRPIHRSVGAVALLLALGAGSAEAAVPVQLPPGEDPQRWAALFATHDLEAGQATPGAAWVQLEDKGAHWDMHVRDPQGVVHQENVAEPATEEERAAIVWLARTHLDGKPPEVEGAPVPAKVVTVERPPSPVWMEAGGGVGLRGDAGAGADLHVAGGTTLAERVRVGLAVDLRPATALDDVGDLRGVGRSEATVGAAWSPTGRFAPGVGASAGVALHSFLQAGATVRNVPTPVVGADLSLAIAVVGPLRVVPYVSGRYGLRPIVLQAPEAEPVDASRWEARAGLAVRWGGPR